MSMANESDDFQCTNCGSNSLIDIDGVPTC
jgi:hypothetical protein